jgi:hypothetical protein
MNENDIVGRVVSFNWLETEYIMKGNLWIVRRPDGKLASYAGYVKDTTYLQFTSMGRSDETKELYTVVGKYYRNTNLPTNGEETPTDRFTFELLMEAADEIYSNAVSKNTKFTTTDINTFLVDIEVARKIWHHVETIISRSKKG